MKGRSEEENMSNLNAEEYKSFESIKHIRESGNEFWYARELSIVLDYTEWRNFQKVIDRVILACKNRGFAVSDHFVEVNKMTGIGKGGKRKNNK